MSMEAVKLVTCLVSLLTGGFSLVVSIFFLVKYKNIVYASYILFYAALFLYASFLTACCLFPLLAVRFSDAFMVFCVTAGKCAKALFVFCLPCLFHYLYEAPHRRGRNIAWVSVSLVVIGAVILRALAFAVIENTPFDYLLESAATLAVYGYLLTLFFCYRSKMRNQEIRPLHTAYILLVSVYIAVVITQDILSAARLIPRPFVTDDFLVPALFIVWNICFLKFIARFFQIKPIVVPGVDAASFDVFHRKDITDRERDIIRGLLTGATVSELAGRLFISVHTAKTHVKNIYQKLGVRNRVELLNAVRAEAETAALRTGQDRPAAPEARPE